MTKKKIIASILVAMQLISHVPVAVANNTSFSKNWYNDYSSTYSVNGLPEVAPAAYGVSTLSSISNYDYKQNAESLTTQAKAYYSNAYTELFVLNDNRLLNNIVRYSTDEVNVGLSTGITALDAYVPNEYEGLSEEELKWLVNNNIISRDPDHIIIDASDNRVSVGNTSYLVDNTITEYMTKSDFLVALHKATYGVIESRPLVYTIPAYRKAQKVVWKKNYTTNSEGNPVLSGYTMEVGEFKDQQVSGVSSYENSTELFRGEFVVRLEGDEHYSVVTYPNDDKLFITSPNVTELYLKSLLDHGIINSQNLYSNKTYNSKNVFSDIMADSLMNAFSSYGTKSSVGYYTFPSYAPELGPYDMSTGISSVPFSVNLTVSNDYIWGTQYGVGETGITFKNRDFFVIEDMLTIDALRFIESILRVTDGDMTDTEAMIVSYKYGANYIDNLTGSDKSTVMYLTAKGILDFDSFDEYRSLYQPLTDELAYTFLYRTANEGARKNFSQIQLTDSDNFWISAGYGSYNLSVKTPDVSAMQSYKDADGDYTFSPNTTGGMNSVSKNHLSLYPYTETLGVSVVSEINTSVSAGTEVMEIVIEYNAPNIQTDEEEYNQLFDDLGWLQGLELEEESVEVDNSSIYDNDWSVVGLSSVVSDANNVLVEVEKSFDNPYKYLYNKKPLITGAMPSTTSAKAQALVDALTNEDGSANLPDGIKKISYNTATDQYRVIFEVEVPDTTSALQLVDSNLECVTDVLVSEQQVNVVSKVTSSGETILLIDESSLSLLDPNIVIVERNLLTNRLTGTQAVIIEDMNMALVGSEIIDSEEDALIVEDTNGVTYYNYNIISSLLSNMLLSPIGEGDLYAMGTISSQEYRDIIGSTGDVMGTGIVGQFAYHTDLGDDDSVYIMRDFINMSQLNNSSNMLSKSFTRNSPSGIPVDFNVIVEWELQLPILSGYVNESWTEDDINPTLGSVNNYYFERPSDSEPEQQDYWDNNIGLSNAIANVMYGTQGVEYIKTGYLVPNITLLFHIDSGYTIGGNTDSSNELRSDVTVPIVGAWFQEVGTQLPESWVSKFVGDSTIYNKIISADITSVDYYGNYKDKVQRVDTGYRLLANAESKYYPDKTMNLDWFPAWVHISFNNPDDSHYYTDVSGFENGTLWRKLGTNRSFSYMVRNERQSVGTVFGGTNLEDTAWMLLPSGTLYKSMNNGMYSNTAQGIMAETRTTAQTYSQHVGKEVNFNGVDYDIIGVDGQYLEIRSQRAIAATYDSDSKEFLSTVGEDLFTVGYNTLKDDFVDNTSTMAGSVGEYEPTYNHYSINDYETSVGYVIQDDDGNTKVQTFSYTDGVMRSYDMSESYYSKQTLLYHPTVRLSTIGWQVKSDGIGGQSLVYDKTVPSAIVGGVMTTSLAKTMIDNVISETVGTTSVSELTSGASIQVGDISLYKIADSTYITSPISIGSVFEVPDLSTGVVDEVVIQRMAGSVLNSPILVNNNTTSLMDYIDSVALGIVDSNSGFDYANTLVAPGGTVNSTAYVTDGTVDNTKKASSGTRVDSVSFTIKLDDSKLNAIGVDKANNEYMLSTVANEPGYSIFSDFAVFTSDLKTTITESSIFETLYSDFLPLLNNDYRKAEFLAEHDAKVIADVLYWVTTSLAFAGAYLSVMCVIMFFSLKNVILYQIFYSIRNPKSGERGYDIVKILTLGTMNIDDEIDGKKLVITVVLILLLFTTIVVLQNNGFFYDIPEPVVTTYYNQTSVGG